MSKIKISGIKPVPDANSFLYQFASSKSLKGIKEGMIIEAIERAVNNPEGEEKELLPEKPKVSY